ncbi:MAG: hypothetical protein U1F06_01150 [Steroidobacteraceae bacterium]
MTTVLRYKNPGWALAGLLAACLVAPPAPADVTDPDPAFGTNGRVELALSANNTALAVVQQAGTGKLVIGGRTSPGSGDPAAHVTRLNTDGSVDTAFASAGTFTASYPTAYAETVDLVQQSDGKLLAVISTGIVATQHVIRLSANGALDATYAADGSADVTVPSGPAMPIAAAIQPADGRLVVLQAGFGTASVFRLNTDGTLDAGFGAPGTPGYASLPASGSAYDIAVQEDGRLLIVGTTDATFGANGDMLVVRLNADGSPDTSFDTDGVVTLEYDGFGDTARAVLQQPDGRIVVAGEAYATSSRPDCALARFNADGSLDAGFGTGGKGRFVRSSLSVCESLALLADGRFIATGRWQPSIDRYFLALRITADGHDDPEFDNGAWYDVYEFPPTLPSEASDPSDGLVQADGRIVIVGTIDGLRSGVLRLATTVNAPDPFAFTDQLNVARSTLVASNTVTISGLAAAASISVTGGEYSRNGGAFTTANGTISSGDTVQVRHTSAAAFSTATNTTLSIAGVSDTFTSTTLAADTLPDAFSFVDQSGVGPSTLVTSNAIAVSGINSTTPISVAGGEYSVNGGAFTAANGAVGNGDSVRVRHTSAATLGATVDTTLTIGGIFDVFTSTTAAPDGVPDAFTFTDQANVTRSATATSNAITVAGINIAASISVTGGEYAVNGGTFTSANGTVSAGDTVQVRHTSAATFSTTTDTTLAIGGVTDTFTTTTLGQDATPDIFHFTAQTGVAPGALVSSNAITVSGINAPADITIAGGEYSINGGAFTSAAGTVVNGDSVTVRLTASASNGTPVTATLTIGGVHGDFDVTTDPGTTTTVVDGEGGGGSFEGWSLAALALLLAGRLRRTRRLQPVALALGALGLAGTPPVQAGEAGFYVAAGAGSSHVGTDAAQLSRRVEQLSGDAVTALSLDGGSTGWHARAGYAFRDWLALEAAYYDFGQVEGRVTADAVDPEVFAAAVASAFPPDPHGVAVQARLSWPFAARLALAARLGAIRWNSDQQARLVDGGAGTFKADSSGTDFAYGAALTWQALEHLGVELEFDGTQGERSVSAASLGLVLRF